MYWTFEHMVCFYLLNVHLWTTFRCFAFIFTIWLKCLPVYWFVVAYRKLEPHSKPHWQWRAFICIALHPSQNPCCLLEVKSKRITAHCQCGQSFLFLCAAVEDLCSFFLFNVRGYGEALHGPMSALVTMWAALVPSLKGKRAERAFLLSNPWSTRALLSHMFKKGSTQVI